MGEKSRCKKCLVVMNPHKSDICSFCRSRTCEVCKRVWSPPNPIAVKCAKCAKSKYVSAAKRDANVSFAD